MKIISISKMVALVKRTELRAAFLQKQTKRTKSLLPLFPSVQFFFLFATLATSAEAQVNLPIGNLAPGESVTITFDVTLTNPFPAGVVSITNQGTISGSNFSPVTTDDPQTPASGDATITLVDVPPFVLTLAATSIGPTTATLNASINPNTFATAAYFQFGPSAAYGSFSATNNLSATNVAVPISIVISNLAPGTLYHFAATATNSAGLSVGDDLTFTTVAIPAPQLNNVVMLGDGSLQFTFTNVAAQPFTVFATTNLALPFSSWTSLGLANEDQPGQFQFTDLQATNSPQRFYRVRWP